MDKVMYIEQFRPQVEVISEKNILYPLYAYDVMITKDSESLDFFEKAVLGAFEIFSNDPKVIAETLGLSEPFVLFVCQRLMQNQYINAKGEVTKGRNKKTEVSETEYVKIFADGISGQLLPYVLKFPPSFAYEYPSSYKTVGKTTYISKFEYGTTGKGGEKDIFRHMLFKNKSPAIPTEKDIRKAARECRKKTSNSGVQVSGIIEGDISISRIPEAMFVFLNVFMQKGYHEYENFLITDGFGFDYACKTITTNILAEPWLAKIREDAVILRYNQNTGVQEEKIYDRYSGIRKNLIHVQPRTITTEAENENYLREITDATRKFRDALEETFKLLNEDYPIAESELRILTMKIGSEEKEKERNADILFKVAKNAGFVFPVVRNSQGGKKEVVPSILAVLPREISSGRGIRFLLATALLSANYDNLHPLKNLVNEHNDFITFINGAKKLTDHLQHQAEVTTKDVYESTHSKILCCICALFPDYSGEVNSGGIGDINNSHLISLIEMENDIGATCLQRVKVLSPGIYSAMRRLYSPAEKPTAADYYTLCQTILEFIRGPFSGGSTIFFNCKEKATKKIEAFVSPPLPAEISSINSVYVDSAVNGRPSTLGAVLLSIFYHGDDDLLQSLVMDGIIENTAEIIKLRGHGQSLATADELLALRPFLASLLKKL